MTSLLAAPRRLAALGLFLYVAVGCGGERIRLGDGPVIVARGGAPGGGGAPPAGMGGGGFGGLAEAGRAGGSSGGSGTANAGGSSAAAGGSGEPAGGGGLAGAPDCPNSGILANQVLWIGDSWARKPVSRVNEYAQTANLIGTNEGYRSLAADGASMADIAQQYETGQSGTATVRILLMDGGTWDPVFAQINGLNVTEAINGALDDFRQFLGKVASDGTVEHIVYILVPPLPNIPGVDTMRQPLMDACSASTVQCHFIDLKDAWQNHPEYTESNGFQATAAGVDEIAASVWQTMQTECIAQ